MQYNNLKFFINDELENEKITKNTKIKITSFRNILLF